MAARDPALRASAIHADISMLRADKPVFGITSEKDAVEDADRAAKEIGCRPMWRGVYASIGAPFELSRLTNAAGIPFLTVQPKDLHSAVEQKSWSLAATLAGTNDAKLRAVADTVVEYGDLMVIRYAPEMNGDWSPWAAGVNGNTASQYVEAWQYVVTLFREAGATNVLWLWAPNIIRGATVEGISQFWPGDEWVDLIGFTGYGVGSSMYGFESAAGQTFDPTMKMVARLSKKPVVLAETGVEGAEKSRWMATLGPWLRAHPNVIGLIWTQAPPPHSNADWRYNDSPRNMKAFKKSVVPNLTCAPSR